MENAPEINKENINRFLCPNCGANMVFDAKHGKLACPYCAHSQEVAADGTVDERDYHEFLAARNAESAADGAKRDAVEMRQLRRDRQFYAARNGAELRFLRREDRRATESRRSSDRARRRFAVFRDAAASRRKL